jgi:hypothetical protein
LPRGSGRAVQAGGSTGTPFFRFVDGESGYEANQIVAEGNVIIGGSSSFSWVNIDGGLFHHNLVSRPGQWVARILNENGGLPIVDTQNGKFQDNRIVYNDTASEFSTAVNVGPETLPSTYTFARNQWLNLANPTAAGSTPGLPVSEAGGIYGVGPAATTDGPHVWDFAWGKWIVNANATQQTVDVTALQSMRQAIAGPDASFGPLDADPLGGVWTSMDVLTSTLLLPAFSQAILIDPAACLSCLPITGDYNDDGTVDAADYTVWRNNLGDPNESDLHNNGDGDGVTESDYTWWKQHYGNSNLGPGGGGLTQSTVPEPITLTMLLAIALSILVRRRAVVS